MDAKVSVCVTLIYPDTVLKQLPVHFYCKFFFWVSFKKVRGFCISLHPSFIVMSTYATDMFDRCFQV